MKKFSITTAILLLMALKNLASAQHTSDLWISNQVKETVLVTIKEDNIEFYPLSTSTTYSGTYSYSQAPGVVVSISEEFYHPFSLPTFVHLTCNTSNGNFSFTFDITYSTNFSYYIPGCRDLLIDIDHNP